MSLSPRLLVAVPLAAASVATGVVSPTFSLPFDLVGDAGPTLACP
jgi:hypothetical protein